MAQGKAYTPEQREEIIRSLKDFLEMGFSRNKACEMIGFNPMTLSGWVKDDEALLMKLQGWENAVNVIAIKNIKDAIIAESKLNDDTRKDNSWKWAEKRIKDLGVKQEIEHSGTVKTDDGFTEEERAELMSLIKR